MNGILLFSLTVLWLVVFVNLALTFRLVRWVVAQKETRLRFLRSGPELTIGAPAPPFRARTLAGQPVATEDFLGRQVALIFSSPFCDRCRREMPALIELAGQAERNAATELVLISDADLATTRVWLETMRKEDSVQVPLPVLAAPTTESTLTTDYNPVGAVPFFCLLDAVGAVASRGLVGQEEWTRLERSWSGRPQLASWMAHRH